MRYVPALLALPPLLLILGWALVGGTDLNRPALDRAEAALADMRLANVSLRTDVLGARSGLLRNYDPIVSGTKALRVALDGLHRSGAAMGWDGRLDDLRRRQEDLLEQFKSNNALLQNSLAYFSDFSQRLAAGSRTAGLVSAARALAASMLRLTLDTSPEAMKGVDAQLAQEALQARRLQDLDVTSLVAHARLLRKLLPETDGVVRTIAGLPWNAAAEGAERSLAVAREEAQRRAAEYRKLLSAGLIVVLTLMTWLGISLRARARAQRRARQFNALLTDSSIRLAGAAALDSEDALERILTSLAEWADADGAGLLVGGRQIEVATGPVTPHRPAVWPPGLLTKLASFTAAQPGAAALVRDVSRREPDELKELLAQGSDSLAGWAGIARVRDDSGTLSLLCVWTRAERLRVSADEVALLRMVLDALVTAARRTEMEKERLRLEADLYRLRRAETIAALTGGVAHNFNNIVGAILGHAEIAEARGTSDRLLAESLAQVRRAGERARDLTERILAFGQRQAFVPEPVELRALLAETRAQLDVTLPTGITLAPHGPDRELIVMGQPSQLQQVVVNLCNNAAQAMDGQGTVALSLAAAENGREHGLSGVGGALPPGLWAVISVRDGGRGIDRAILPRIFEPFFTTRRDGNGLGLATVRDIVSEHGGQIDVKSGPGEGALFEVFLPLAAAAGRRGEQQAGGMRGDGQTVLVFNGEATALLRVEELVAALGYEPVGFTSATEALAAAASQPRRFDVALLAAGEDGAAESLASHLRTSSPRLPILLAAGQGAAPESERAWKLRQSGIRTVTAEPSQLAAALAQGVAARKSSVA